MQKNTSVSLGSYFDRFVETKITQGRYKNASEVIRAGLRLLEEDESRIAALKNAIAMGEESGVAVDFDPSKHLETLKAGKANG
ncbi:type II toxin-antitoxin system ParD family antitoxin [Bacteroides thetaiotaomicron]|uniref:type II toxin-antitoxin system ParD family antitoxin n=1 Tax=Bacteroides thetaiotaomicron TaxID=818 RepID=UPI001C8BA917|nr:type II toxin-antitoxin system ParD family antitoxin [Bacteroides thetaiotaomicron]MBX9049616.1 type II toxin-antitoxin system ParD family antitoxin [Bacteroides thetaiotaomicron]MBX9072958.1 type II toxin-antitoxin system ParD family antitoxin [Bacteroides thetaiotaomicron]